MSWDRGARGWSVRAWLTSPHVAKNLDVAGNLFLGALYAGLLEVVNEELVAPPAATTRVRRPGGLPVLAKTCIDETGEREGGGWREQSRQR